MGLHYGYGCTLDESDSGMKTFFYIAGGLAGFVIIGFFTYAIMSSSEEKELDIDPSKEGYIGFGAPDQTDPPSPQALLNADRQFDIWTAEHAVFELEHRFGPAFRKALIERDPEAVAAFFQSSFSGSVPTADWLEETRGLITRRTRESAGGDNAAAADEVAAALVEGIAAVVSVEDVGLVVHQVRNAADNVWVCRVQVTVRGKTDADLAVHTDSRHDVEFRFEDEKTLATAPSVSRWDIVSQEARTGSHTIMEEVTKAAGLSSVPIPTNNRLPMGKAKPYWFQYAVADFDLDGDPDIAAATIQGKRVILRNDDGVFRYATKALKLPVDYGEVPQHYLSFWMDYDNDGYPDLVSGRSLFRNEEGKRLTDTSTYSGINFEMGAMGVAIADFDCDGLLDFYILQQRSERGDISGAQSWVAKSTGGGENHLWRNLGDGRFEDVTQRAGVGGGPLESFSATWFFYNDDHYPDLYVANDRAPNALFLNRGDGTFEDISQQAGIDRFSNTSSVTAGDVNNDGRCELYESNLYSMPGQRVVSLLTPDDYPDGVHATLESICSGNRLLRHAGDGLSDVAQEARVVDGGWSWGAAMPDLNSDGWLDLYVASGFLSFDPSQPDRETSYWRAVATEPRYRGNLLPQIMVLDAELNEFWSPTPFMITQRNENLSAFQPNRVFMGVDGDRFDDAGFTSGMDIAADSRSPIAADVDGDGALDLIVGSANTSPLRVFRNTLPQGGRVDIRLVGTDSNRQGIGSRVTAEVGDRTIVRDVFPHGNFLCTGPAHAWIGIGDATTIDRLTVRWPTGKTQVFENVDANRRIQIREGDSEIRTLAAFGE